MFSALPSLFILSLVAFAALRITQTQPSPPGRVGERKSASQALGFAVVIQAAHFSEEAMTGFHERFPALMDFPAMPFSFFIAFNLVWLVIWVASISGLRAASPFAFFAAWFLAIAGMLNGVAHLFFALEAKGYFPGLATSPYSAGAGIWLWIQLRRATQEA